MQMFRQSPFWQAIKQHEAQLEVFIDQVLQYQPPPPEEDGEAEDLREAATI